MKTTTPPSLRLVRELISKAFAARLEMAGCYPPDKIKDTRRRFREEEGVVMAFLGYHFPNGEPKAPDNP